MRDNPFGYSWPCEVRASRNALDTPSGFGDSDPRNFSDNIRAQTAKQRSLNQQRRYNSATGSLSMERRTSFPRGR